MSAVQPHNLDLRERSAIRALLLAGQRLSAKMDEPEVIRLFKQDFPAYITLGETFWRCFRDRVAVIHRRFGNLVTL